MFFIIFSSLLAGAIGAVLLQLLLFCVYIKSKPRLQNPRRHQYERPKISEDLRNLDGKLGQEETAHSLNAIFAFLFGELKDTRFVRRWVVRKLNVELEELLHTKTAGRVLEQITVRDYCLGSTVPTITNMSLITCKSSAPGKAPEEVDVALSVKYTGGFRISVDVDLVFGTSAYVSITVSKLEGKGRLSFTRHPYTHWSFSFFEEPELEFSTQSHFEGRVVPQLSGLIINQIKKTIRKKHILPAYKLRYKPFFIKPEPLLAHDEVLVENSKLTVGVMHITVVECSRLPFSKEIENTEMYCSLSIDAIAWRQEDIEKKFLGEIFEVEICKGPNKVVGVLFQLGSYEKEVLVSSISPESPAINKNLRQGDRVLYVDGVKAQTPKQVARLVKQAKDKFSLKVQRPFIWNESMVTPTKVSDDPKDMVIPVDEPDYDNEYEEFSGPIIATFESLGAESNQRPSSPSRLEVPSHESPVLRRRSSSKQPTTDDGRRLSSSLDYETAKQLKEKLQQTAEDKIKNVKTIIQESMQARKEGAGGKPKHLENEKVSNKQNSLKVEAPILQVEVDPDTVSLSSLSQLDEPDVTSGEMEQAEQISLASSLGEEDRTQETTLVPADRDPRWDETFSFQTKESDCYINVCVWNRIKGTFGERDIILGYASVPLIDIAMQCLTTLSGEYLELFKLQPPELQGGASRNPDQAKVFKHPGYEHRLSFGDITLFFHHEPQEGVKPSEVKDKVPVSDKQKLSDARKTQIQAAAEKPVRPHPRQGERKSQRTDNQNGGNNIAEGTRRLHVFLGTHFSLPTRCDFCTKKVWTKFAYQCQGCHFICHKKCSDKVQLTIPCDRTKKYHELQPQPQIKQPLDLGLHTEATSSVPSSPTVARKDPPKPPPSPQLSSSSSDEEGEDDEDIEVMVRRLNRLKRRLLSTSQNEVTKKEEVDHMVMTVAREMGRELFLNLPTAERKLKLETIINKLQKEIDAEAEQQADLFLKKENATSSKEKARAAEAFAKSEQRMQTLAMLMLHYCSGIQHCNEELSSQADETASEAKKESEKATEVRKEPEMEAQRNEDHEKKIEEGREAERNREAEAGVASDSMKDTAEGDDAFEHIEDGATGVDGEAELSDEEQMDKEVRMEIESSAEDTDTDEEEMQRDRRDDYM